MANVFNLYSKYYDLLYKDKDYAKEADYIASLCKSNVTTLLELGCGTGQHANFLTQKGYAVYGIDLSEGMIEQARKLGLACEVADVRTFRASQTFDAVISLFHIASYQTSDKDINDYFKTASIHLATGGNFIFDAWYKPAVLAQVPENRVKEMQDEHIHVVRKCTPNHIKEKNIVEVHYDIYITDKKTNEKHVVQECHAMRYFNSDELCTIAKKHNIKIVHEEEWMTKKTPSQETWGVCFVGEKI